MDFEWDDRKNAANRAKHGQAFERIAEFDWTNALVLQDDRKEYGETRYRTFGYIGQRLYAVIFTIRGSKIRIISLRKANNSEVKAHG